jgi:hypothetical protein
LSKKFLTSLNLLGKATDPATGTAGDLYYNTVLQTVKVYTGTEWTVISGGGGGSASITVGDNTPADPTEGSMWFESDTGRFFVYYDSFWVELGAPGSQGPQGLSGATGADGAPGPAGVVIQETAPTNTTVLWLDTSVVAVNAYTQAQIDALAQSAAIEDIMNIY